MGQAKASKWQVGGSQARRAQTLGLGFTVFETSRLYEKSTGVADAVFLSFSFFNFCLLCPSVWDGVSRRCFCRVAVGVPVCLATQTLIPDQGLSFLPKTQRRTVQHTFGVELNARAPSSCGQCRPCSQSFEHFTFTTNNLSTPSPPLLSELGGGDGWLDFFLPSSLPSWAQGQLG